METEIDNMNPDSVFLNPEYLESLNQVPEITDDEFREFILTHNYEMPIELQKYIDEYMKNPLNRTDSKVLGWIKDWIEHPEKCQWYRDHVLFPSTEEKYFSDSAEDNPGNIRIEIPILSMDF